MKKRKRGKKSSEQCFQEHEQMRLQVQGSSNKRFCPLLLAKYQGSKHYGYSSTRCLSSTYYSSSSSYYYLGSRTILCGCRECILFLITYYGRDHSSLARMHKWKLGSQQGISLEVLYKEREDQESVIKGILSRVSALEASLADRT